MTWIRHMFSLYINRHGKKSLEAYEYNGNTGTPTTKHRDLMAYGRHESKNSRSTG
jgi:hypothetical protein